MLVSFALHSHLDLGITIYHSIYNVEDGDATSRVPASFPCQPTLSADVT